MADQVFFWSILVFLFLMLGVGVYASKKIKGDSVNYIVAGRGLLLPLATATLMAQAVDSNGTLGNTDLTAKFGFWAGASLPLGIALCLFLTGLFFAKPLNRMNLITFPDFYRRKYGRVTEFVASLIMVMSFSFLLAGNLVAGGFLFETFLGTSYTAGVVLITLIAFIYTITGGLFAVAYTDAIQAGVALFGSLALIGYVWGTFGITIPEGSGPLAFEQLTNPEAGAIVNWATLLALGLGDIVAIDFMERVFAADSPQTAQRACFMGCIGTIIVGVPFSIVALSASQILEEAGVTADDPILFALLENVIPLALALPILGTIISASLSTSDGAILGTSSVFARNIIGVRGTEDRRQGDKLLWTARSMAVPIALLGIVLALRVPETGVLLLLAFDIGFAALLVPLAGGLYWLKATKQGALACIAVGSVTRLVLFALMPVMFGIENTLLYIPNDIFTKDFDGIPTLISPLVGLVTFIAVSHLTYGRGENTSKRSPQQHSEQIKQQTSK